MSKRNKHWLLCTYDKYSGQNHGGFDILTNHCTLKTLGTFVEHHRLILQSLGLIHDGI